MKSEKKKTVIVQREAFQFSYLDNVCQHISSNFIQLLLKVLQFCNAQIKKGTSLLN